MTLDEQRCAAVRVAEARPLKAPVCTLHFGVAEQADVAHLIEQLVRDFCEALRSDTLTSRFEVVIDAFEIGGFARLCDDIRVEN